jgi:signal peptidase I
LPAYQQDATDAILKQAAEQPVIPKVKKEPPRGQLTEWSTVKDYVFAGKAVFTLHNPKTGVRLTYKVTAKKGDLKVVEDARQTAEHDVEHGQELSTDTEQRLRPGYVTYFVNVLRGPDNTADFTYLGVLRKPGDFFITAKSQVTRKPTSYKALVWFLDAMRCEREILGGSPLEVWHSGRCGRCGKLLTVPASVARGLGAICDGLSAAEGVKREISSSRFV